MRLLIIVGAFSPIPRPRREGLESNLQSMAATVASLCAIALLQLRALRAGDAMTYHGSNAHGVVADHRADAAWLGSASRAALGECVTRAPLQTTQEILCRSSMSAQDENSPCSRSSRSEARHVQMVLQPATPILKFIPSLVAIMRSWPGHIVSAECHVWCEVALVCPSRARSTCFRRAWLAVC